MKRILFALLVVPSLHAGPFKSEEDKNRECIAQFLQDAVKAIEYTAQDAKNEQEQKVLLAQLNDRITQLENNQDGAVSMTFVAALAGVLGGALGSYLMNYYAPASGYVLGGQSLG